MQVATILDLLFLTTAVVVTAFAFHRLNTRVRIQYKSRFSFVALLLSAFVIFLISVVLFISMGFIFPEQMRVEIYVIGLVLILCAIVILFSSNLLIKEREYFKQFEKIQVDHDSITGLPKHQMFLERTKNTASLGENDIPVVLIVLISGLRQLDRRMGFGMSDYVLRNYCTKNTYSFAGN